MSRAAWLRHSRRVAATEWRRDDREFDHPLSSPAFGLAVAVVVGWFTYAFGREYVTGSLSLPVPPWLLVSLVLGETVLRSGRLAQRRFTRLDPALFLPTVPVRVPALGLLGFVYARIVARISPPAIGLAAGLGVALASPALALAILVATPVLAAFLVAFGAASRLGAHYVGTRAIDGRPVRGSLRLLAVLVFALGGAVVAAVSIGDATVVEPGGFGPLSWVIAFTTPTDASMGVLALQGLAVLAVFALCVAALVGVTISLVRRIWIADSVGPSRAVDADSLLAHGWLDRLLGGVVPRSTLIQLRATWRIERRNPRGLLYPVYALAFASVIGFPVFALAGLPIALLLVLGLGLAAGVVFTADPIGRSYRPFPMVLTTADARAFVGGPLVATLLTAVVVLAVGFVPLGLLSSASVPETLLLALVGVGVAMTTGSTVLAMELGVPYDAFGPVPTFFADVRTYGQRGWGSFRPLAASFLWTCLVVLPAVLGNAAWIYEPLGDRGAPIVAVRLGSLALTICVAAVVAWWASRVATERYRFYRLDA